MCASLPSKGLWGAEDLMCCSVWACNREYATSSTFKHTHWGGHIPSLCSILYLASSASILSEAIWAELQSATSSHETALDRFEHGPHSWYFPAIEWPTRIQDTTLYPHSCIPFSSTPTMTIAIQESPPEHSVVHSCGSLSRYQIRTSSWDSGNENHRRNKLSNLSLLHVYTPPEKPLPSDIITWVGKASRHSIPSTPIVTIITYEHFTYALMHSNFFLKSPVLWWSLSVHMTTITLTLECYQDHS